MKLTKLVSFVLGSAGVAHAADLSDPKVRSFINDLLGLQTKAGFQMKKLEYTPWEINVFWKLCTTF